MPQDADNYDYDPGTDLESGTSSSETVPDVADADVSCERRPTLPPAYEHCSEAIRLSVLTASLPSKPHQGQP